MDQSDLRRILLTTIVLGILYALAKVLLIGSRPSNLPPGPPTLPIIGNLHQTRRNLHLQYIKSKENYDLIFTLKYGAQTVIVLTDGRVIRELIDARGSKYAERPDLWVRGLFDHSRIIMRGYDAMWRLERKLYHSELNFKASKKYLSYQELEALKMCVDLLEDPGDWITSIGRMTGSIATSMTYGIRLPDKDNEGTRELPFAELLLRSWNPIAREAVEAYESEKAVFKKYYKIGLEGHMPCFTQDVAAAQDKWRGTPDGQLLTDHAACYIAGISFEGAADTKRYTLQGFVKRNGQAEIDAIVGSGEHPSAKHLSSLRYIVGLAKESIRWMPTVANGVIPHAAAEDDKFRSFRISKGASIVMGVWAANNDIHDFPDPRHFDPDRQIQTTSLFETTSAPNPSERGQYGLGSGRWMCPGMHVTYNTLLLAISHMLWVFDIEHAQDENGNDIAIDRDAIVGGLASMPAPFKCTIKARSRERAALVELEWAKMAEVLDARGNYRQPVSQQVS